MSIANLALQLANIFTSLTAERLDDAFQDTHEIQLSKADKVVAMEMMHVKSFEEAYKLNHIGKFTHFELNIKVSNSHRPYHCPFFSCFPVKLRGDIGILLFQRNRKLNIKRNVQKSSRFCVEMNIRKAPRAETSLSPCSANC